MLMTPAAGPALPDSTPPFLVGREREEAMLRGHLTAARAGHGSLVLIGGEAGIGKTALAEAACREAAEQGALVLVGRCYDLTETPPYGPWVELFARYRDTDRMPPLPEAFAKRGTVGEVESQAALFTQVQAFLAALATPRPVVLLLDDLHWADPASLDLLRFLARSLSTMPFLLMATYRADELTRRHPLYQLLPVLVREAHAGRLDLQRIEAADIRTLVGARYHLPAAETERLVAYLDGRSEGNPFFLTELLRTLEAARALRRAAQGWALGDLTQIRVPMLLRQVIDGRLARLGDEAQRLLAIASVIGQDVPLRSWTAIADADDETFATTVERATEAQVLEAPPDGASVRFTHALIRETLYEGIVPMRRRGWHRQIGEHLMTMANADPDHVAHHLGQAEDARTTAWLIRAGERAQRAYAWATAAARYETALTQLTESSERGWLLYRLARMRRLTPKQAIECLDEAIRMATAVGDRPLAALATFNRGLIRTFDGHFGQGVTEMTAGLNDLETLSSDELAYISRHSLQSYANIKMERGTLISQMVDTGRLAEARAMGERFVAENVAPSDDSSHETAYGDCWAGLGSAYSMLGLPDKAYHAFEQAVIAYQAMEHHTMTALTIWSQLHCVVLPYHTDRVSERQQLAIATEGAWMLGTSVGFGSQPLFPCIALMLVEGRWEEAHALALATKARGMIAPPRIYAMRTLATLAREQGDAETAWAQVREMFPEGPATAPGDILFDEAIRFQPLAATLALDAGDLVTAHAWLEAHDRWLTWSGAIFSQSEGQALWARYYHAAGDAERAYRYARQALVRATEPRQPLALLAAHRLLGALDTEAGRYEEAATHLDASLGLADACAAPFERALTLLAWAELHAATGRREEAVTLLDEVRAICTPLGAQPTLARADALTTRLAATHAAPPAFPAGLSAREVEVLRLIAAGRTNREIADALFLSPGTVNIHVTHILTKTNTANRAEAAAFAQRHGLA